MTKKPIATDRFFMFEEYQRAAMRTRNKALTPDETLLNAAMGMNGEAGEVIDHMKKALFQGASIDRTKLIRETGDLLWYCALMAEALDVPLAEIAQINIAKLRARYPNGFDADKSNHRAKGDD